MTAAAAAESTAYRASFSAAGPVHASRDLDLLNFNLGAPEQAPAVSGIDVALVRDGRIAVLHNAVDGSGLTRERSENERPKPTP